MSEATKETAHPVVPDLVPRYLPGLREVLQQKNVSQAALATHCGIGTHLIHAVVNLTRRAEPWMIEKIAPFLQTDLATLTTGEIPVRRRKPVMRLAQPEGAPQQVTLTLEVNDQTYTVSANGTLSQKLLGRMGEALFLLIESPE